MSLGFGQAGGGNLGLRKHDAWDRPAVEGGGLAAKDVAGDTALHHRAMGQRETVCDVADREHVAVDPQLSVHLQHAPGSRQARQLEVELVEIRSPAGRHDDARACPAHRFQIGRGDHVHPGRFCPTLRSCGQILVEVGEQPLAGGERDAAAEPRVGDRDLQRDVVAAHDHQLCWDLLPLEGAAGFHHTIAVEGHGFVSHCS